MMDCPQYEISMLTASSDHKTPNQICQIDQQHSKQETNIDDTEKSTANIHQISTPYIPDEFVNSIDHTNSFLELHINQPQNNEKNKTRKLLAKHEFSNENSNYTRGCLFSPDGLYILNYNNDNTIRLFEPPEHETPCKTSYDFQSITDLKAALAISIAGPIYDVDWYPLMNSANPGTGCLAVTAQYQPVHLYDAYDGQLRATYRYQNKVFSKCKFDL